MAKRAAAAKRKLVNTGTDKRYVRRSSGGRFKESDDVGRSLAKDSAAESEPRRRSEAKATWAIDNPRQDNQSRDGIASTSPSPRFRPPSGSGLWLLAQTFA